MDGMERQPGTWGVCTEGFWARGARTSVQFPCWPAYENRRPSPSACPFSLPAESVVGASVECSDVQMLDAKAKQGGAGVRTLYPFPPPRVEAGGVAEEALAAYALKRGSRLWVLTTPPHPAPARENGKDPTSLSHWAR